MNAEDENHEADDAFERELARFHRADPPDAWRDELIANAIPALDSAPARKGRQRFSLPEKFFGGALGGAWLVIFSLWIATPADHQSARTSPSPPIAMPNPNQTVPFPILAWRRAGGETGEELFP